MRKLSEILAIGLRYYQDDPQSMCLKLRAAEHDQNISWEECFAAEKYIDKLLGPEYVFLDEKLLGESPEIYGKMSDEEFGKARIAFYERNIKILESIGK